MTITIAMLTLSFGLFKTAQPTVTNEASWSVARRVSIWSANESGKAHNAFPQMVRHGTNWYVALREGSSHNSADGDLRVIRSTDGGTNWASVLSVTTPPVGYSDARGNAIASDGTNVVVWCGWGNAVPSTDEAMTCYSSSDGTSWTTNAAGPTRMYPHSAVKYGSTWYVSAFSAHAPYAYVNWLASSSDLSTYSASTSNGWSSAAEGALYMDGATMRMVMRRNDATYLVPYHHQSSASSPYSTWTQTSSMPWRIDGSGASPSSGATFGQCVLGREYDFSPCDYVGKTTSCTMIWRMVNNYPAQRIIVALGHTDGGYGDCEEYNGKLYGCYYAGNYTTANVYWIEVTK